MHIKRFIFILLTIIISVFLHACSSSDGVILSCKSDNDLFVVLKENKIANQRFDTPQEAVSRAPAGSAVMILADEYPARPTNLNQSIFDEAARKKLRLYIEYPSYLPETTIGETRGTHWERAVISSDAFGPDLPKLRILAIHDCRFVTLNADNPDIVIARVAGFDNSVYGLPKETSPILINIPGDNKKAELLVSTTKLSQFLTARYSPTDAWKSIWKYIFSWLQPGEKAPELKWTAHVRPSYHIEDSLPEDVERKALRRGIEWFYNSHMILHPNMMEQYNKPANGASPSSANPDLTQDWPYGHRINKMIKDPVTGDGTLGIMEGYDAKIFFDGSQLVRWWLRGDCNAEIAGAMGLAGLLLKNDKYSKTASNIGDWLFFRSMMSLGDRADPDNPAFGLFGWNDSPQYVGPGSGDGFGVYYGDDNARVALGMMLAATAQKTDRYDQRLLRIIMGNLRISGVNGFQPDRIDQGPLMKIGWEKLFTSNRTSFSPHYQANMLACYLWAFQQTGLDLFRERAKTAIRMMMEAYPDKWVWTNGIQQERAKMLLPLSWLIRIEDTPEHRAWLERIAADLLAKQDKSGAIQEEIGTAGKGGCPPPASNEAYGSAETPLIQENGDCVSDLLYTIEFAFIGLHEAAAATGLQFYRDAEDKLAEFLCRIQIRSEKHSELDGGWFRAFDFKRWEYWASNADAGWGAWSIESGWSQSWITAVLALRQLHTSFWDFTRDSRIETHFMALREAMFPDNTLK